MHVLFAGVSYRRKMFTNNYDDSTMKIRHAMDVFFLLDAFT